MHVRLKGQPLLRPKPNRLETFTDKGTFLLK